MSKSAKVSSGRPRIAGESTPRDAIALLKADHREIEDLFEEYEHTNSVGSKATVAMQICDALRIHMQIEEEVFYPAFIAETGDTLMHHEAIVEHEGAMRLMEDLEAATPEDGFYDAKVKVLSEMIRHHVRQEEKPQGMFARARSSSMDLKALAADMFTRKNELQTKRAGRHSPHAFI